VNNGKANMDDDLGRMWNNMIMVYFKDYLNICLEELKNSTEILKSLYPVTKLRNGPRTSKI
jgi:hypothetical protein